MEKKCEEMLLSFLNHQKNFFLVKNKQNKTNDEDDNEVEQNTFVVYISVPILWFHIHVYVCHFRINFCFFCCYYYLLPFNSLRHTLTHLWRMIHFILLFMITRRTMTRSIYMWNHCHITIYFDILYVHTHTKFSKHLSKAVLLLLCIYVNVC